MPDEKDKAAKEQQDEKARQQRQADEDRSRDAQARLRSGTGDEAESKGEPRIGAIPAGATETEQRAQRAATDPLRLSPEARTAEGATEPIMLGDSADGNDPAIALKRATEAPRTVSTPATEEIQAEPQAEAKAGAGKAAGKDKATAQPRDAQQEDTTPAARSQEDTMPWSGTTIDLGNGQMAVATMGGQAMTGATPATVAAAGSLSGAIDTGGMRLAGVTVPAGWTAAVLTFQASLDGSTYYDLFDDAGNEVTSQAAASRAIGFDAIAVALSPWRYLKVRSGTSASPVAQASGASIAYALKGA